MPSKSQRKGRKSWKPPGGPILYGDEKNALFTTSQNPSPFSFPHGLPSYSWFSNGQNCGFPNLLWQYPVATGSGFTPNPSPLIYNPYHVPREKEKNTDFFPIRQPTVPYRYLPPPDVNSLRSGLGLGYGMGPYGGSSHTSLSTYLPPSPSQDSLYSQQMASGSSSDIERLRKLKETILAGQHPFFKAVPNPDALAKLYLGPHPSTTTTTTTTAIPSSPVYNGLSSPDPQQQQIYKEEPEPVEDPSGSQVSFKGGPSTDLRLVSEKTSTSTSSTSPNLANVSVSVSESPSQSAATIVHPVLKNGTVDSVTSTSMSTSIQDQDQGPAPSVSLPKDDFSRVVVPSPPAPPAPPASVHSEAMDIDKPQAVPVQDPKPSHPYRDSSSHLVRSPKGYETERDRDRERERDRDHRTGYPAPALAPGPPPPSEQHPPPPRSDSYRYSQYSSASDRRDTGGRYSSLRYPDLSYDKDHHNHHNHHHRHWDRDRDRDRDRDGRGEKGRPFFDRNVYERPPRRHSFMERRASTVSISASTSFSNSMVEPKPEPVEDRHLRSEVPPHPEQRPIPELLPRLDQHQRLLPDENLARSSEQRHQPPPLPPSESQSQQQQRASLVPQHPEQRREAVPYPPSEQQQQQQQRRGGELPYAEPMKRSSDTTFHHGRRAPLPYTDLHPPHSDLVSLDAETTARPPLRPSQQQQQQQQGEPPRPIISVPDQRSASRIPEPQSQYPKPSTEPVPPSRLYNENSQREREPYRGQQQSPTTANERIEKGYTSHASTVGGRPTAPYDMKPANSETKMGSFTADTQQRSGSTQPIPLGRNVGQSPGTGPGSRVPLETRSVDPRQQQALPIHEQQNIRNERHSSMDDRDARKYYTKRTPSPPPRRPIVGDKVDVVGGRDQRSNSITSSFRDGPPHQPRSYSADPRSLDTGSQQRPPPTHHYPPPPPSPPPAHSHSHSHPLSRPQQPMAMGDRREVVDRREESRQWRERSENYPPYDGQVEPDRGGRRFADTHIPPRGRPPPPHPPSHPHPPSAPASWDRDKDKEYEPWMKYPPRGSPPPPLGSGPPPPPRWEDPPPSTHTHPPPPPPPHRPLQARIGDTYDDRFIPRDAVVDRGRYRPAVLTPPSAADVAPPNIRDTYRENNPRLRPRSPSPMNNRPVPGGTYDGGHRPTKRARDEYDPRAASYYDDARRGGGENDSYANRMPPPPPYYDHRPGPGPGPGPGAGINPRDPHPPYSRDRGPDPYNRRDVPPRSRSPPPPFYPPHQPPPRERSNHSPSPLSSQTRRSVLSTIGTGVNNIVDDPIWNNPFIQDALQLLDQLADVGKTVPFIAPAFVVLKLIIEVEKTARDADSKCNDLLERITFMTSHLLVLKNFAVLPSTRQVVDRVNQALKESAALITTYRKQNRISRRLTSGNRDRFSTCADKIKTCTNDLLISLQIHQTSKLDILSRAIPFDVEDEAARTFIESHGSYDTVKTNRELVAKFAEEQHIQMDDKVMEQLNSNFSESIRQTEERLESILKDNVSAAVVDGLKGLAAQMTEAEAEQRLLCVQCEKEYRNSTNGPKSCSFHVASYVAKDGFSSFEGYPCCSGSAPCQYQYHRATHHSDYPYSSFFDYSYNILRHDNNTINPWVKIESKNLETDTSQIVSVDRLIRWVSGGDYIKEPTILLRVGRVWHTDPYFFDTFTAKELEAISRVVSLTRKTLIYRSSNSAGEFSMAEWELSSEGVISGVRLSAKSNTSDIPSIQICPIDITTGNKSGDIIEISSDDLKSYKPDRPYILPKTIQIGPELPDKPLRARRTDFKTRTSSPEFRMILTPLAPLTVNDSSEGDYFEGGLSVFNNFAITSQNPISIASISASFRLVGEEKYTPISGFELLNATTYLPVTIDPRQSWSFKFGAFIPRADEDRKIDYRWRRQSFVARYHPLRLKITLKDVEDQECSLVMEYIYIPLRPAPKKPEEIEDFYLDDYEVLQRYHVKITNPANSFSFIEVGNARQSVDELKKIVYSAMKTGETEIQLRYCKDAVIPGYSLDRRAVWSAWALVDLSCRRVYAFKVMITQGQIIPTKHFACLGYVLCPEYGNVIDETRPIQLAEEKATLPDLEPYIKPKVILDDEVDDFIPEPPKPVIPNGTHATAQFIIPDALNQRLTSIDDSLSRIAVALEQIVLAMAPPRNL